LKNLPGTTPALELFRRSFCMFTRTRKAFTLLELIVVIVILGVLALIAIPTYNAVIGKSKVSAAKTTAQALERDALALAAFDQATPGETSDTTDASGTTPTTDDGVGSYADAAADELGSDAQVYGSDDVKEYKVVLKGQVVYLHLSGTNSPGTVDTTAKAGAIYAATDLNA
jgi:type IV pilus assembly protein PilA